VVLKVRVGSLFHDFLVQLVILLLFHVFFLTCILRYATMDGSRGHQGRTAERGMDEIRRLESRMHPR
jgi:hypothetical protein